MGNIGETLILTSRNDLEGSVFQTSEKEVFLWKDGLLDQNLSVDLRNQVAQYSILVAFRPVKFSKLLVYRL
jgi:hypothetical protein